MPRSRIQSWERIYLEEGPEGLYLERRGRGRKEGQPKLAKKVKEDLIAEVQRLRAENAYLKNLQALVLEDERRQPKKTLVIRELRRSFPLALLLFIAQLPRATFYYHMKHQAEPDKYGRAKEELKAVYHEHKGRYGYRRITMELCRRGLALNHKTVQRLMKELGLVCRVRMKKYKSYRGEVGKIAPDLLQRDFEAAKPNQKWVTDVTEFSLFGQKLYLSPILDLCSRDVVSYALSDKPVLSMVTRMLDKAFAQIPESTDLILHSDQGLHYRHEQYQWLILIIFIDTDARIITTERIRSFFKACVLPIRAKALVRTLVCFRLTIVLSAVRYKVLQSIDFAIRKPPVSEIYMLIDRSLFCVLLISIHRSLLLSSGR